MQITDVTYTMRRTKRDYEHDEVTVKAIVEEGEDVLQAMAQVKYSCEQAIKMTVQASKPKEEAPVKEEVKGPAKKKVAKKTTKKVTKKDPAKKEAVKETPAVTLTLADVKKKLGEVWKDKGKSVAEDILKDFNATRSDELQEKDYGAVIEECDKALK